MVGKGENTSGLYYIAGLPAPLDGSSNDVTWAGSQLEGTATAVPVFPEPYRMDSAQTGQSRFALFSPKALALLPKISKPKRYLRADAIPDSQQSAVRDYHAINLPPQVRVPKKVPTPVHVEGKVWFANERSKSFLNFE